MPSEIFLNLSIIRILNELARFMIQMHGPSDNVQVHNSHSAFCARWEGTWLWHEQGGQILNPFFRYSFLES